MGHVLLAAGAAFLAAAALHDAISRTVPNLLCLALALAGVAQRALDHTIVAALPASGAVFLLAALAWRRGWMGGGDVKLLGAAALVVPPALVPSLVLTVALAGGVLSLPYLLARGRVTVPPRRPAGLIARIGRVERWRLRRGGPLPYAVAIAAGGILTIL